MNDQQAQTLILTNRAELKINGVTHATSAAESLVCIETTMGGMSIKGKKLHVEKLDTETGEFLLLGEVQDIRYTPAKKSFFKRLFK